MRIACSSSCLTTRDQSDPLLQQCRTGEMQSMLRCYATSRPASVVQAGGMSDSDTPKYSRKKQDLSKHKRALQSKCRWTVWVPVTLTLILVVCLYLRRHHSDVASGYWSHISAIKTSDQNLSYYYRVSADMWTLLISYSISCSTCMSPDNKKTSEHHH